MKIQNITLKKRNIELTEPYKLSYKTLNYYEAIITETTLDNGTKLYGEVVPLQGYSDETHDQIISILNKIIPNLLHRNISDAIKYLQSILTTQNTFALSSIIPPLEYYLIKKNNGTISNFRISKSDFVASLPLYENTSDLDKKLTQLKKNYKTLKVKIGKSLKDELAFIQRLNTMTDFSFRLRFDANGGYTLDEAKQFIDMVSLLSHSIDYIEQPLCKNCWNQFEEIIQYGADKNIHIMIDESIYSLQDIMKASDCGAKYIKLKLCKFGSFEKLKEAVSLAKSLGLKVVFGNGVATDISNYYEVLFYIENKSLIYAPVESVGFLKTPSFKVFNLLERLNS